MQFDRLRLTGFKSFVDPTDLVILPGLTGVVGPNGCGKSNLLEALRWVMGENRPTAMRGAGMEDVIFAGSGRRPARAQAEVTISIDNTGRLAPVGLNDADRLDITRRITRDAGSAYRVNGKEVRARDVQMLFADASTGAHSPALVRQGQIAALIGARPQARRRILEEAAGISGLYQRRHEAVLKLDGAEANLRRVDETLDGLAAQAAALSRQARAAARYREIGAALRIAEGQLLWRRWADAEAARADAAAALEAAIRTASAAEATARRATTEREGAEAALPPLREAEHVASAILSRATAQREALDEAEARAAAAIADLTARIAQLDRDIAREAVLNRDAGDVLARIAQETAALAEAGAGHEDRLAAASAAAGEAAASLRALEAGLSAAQDEASRLAARHQSAGRLAVDLREMLDRATRAGTDAEARAAHARDAGRAATAALNAARAAARDAAAAVTAADAALTEAEAARTIAETAEAAARGTRAAAEGEAGALIAERAALDKLAQRSTGANGALLAQITVAAGWEAAFGAALGDDLTLGLAAAPGAAGWHTLPPLDGAAPLPDGAAPLAPHVTAPSALDRRLGQIGTAEGLAVAQALQPSLRPGQRLVTPAGDLLRWDGMVCPAAGAASAAALHLQTVNRLRETAAQAEAAAVRAAAAATAHEAARAALATAASTEAAARTARRNAERALSDAARAEAPAESQLSLATGRAEAAEAEAARHTADAADARTRLTEADRALAALPDQTAAATALAQAKAGLEAARIALAARRAAADELRRDAAARDKRAAELAREDKSWRARLDQAGARAAELDQRRAAAAAELSAAEDAPVALAARRTELAQAEAAGTARLTQSRAAMAAAEAALRAAATAEREAEAAAGTAREARAALEARAEASGEAEAAARARIRDEAETNADALRARLPEGAAPPVPALEAEVQRLRAAREAIGAVNLRADEDKRALEAERASLAAEKDDLEAAIRKLRGGIGSLNREGRARLLAAFDTVNGNFRTLFTHLFGGGEARLVMVESDDPLEAGLEIMCQPPGKKLATLSLLSGGEQTLTALALIFAVFLANPAPICVLDEVDAPLDDANVTRFCDLLDEMTRRTATRFLVITHHAVTMARMDRLFGVTMVEQGVSQLVSVDLRRAEALVA